jgi:hypothetical protein
MGFLPGGAGPTVPAEVSPHGVLPGRSSAVVLGERGGA